MATQDCGDAEILRVNGRMSEGSDVASDTASADLCCVIPYTKARGIFNAEAENVETHEREREREEKAKRACKS